MNGQRQQKNQRFDHPSAIFYDAFRELIYIGDDLSVLLFERNGIFIQRLMAKNVYGIYVMNDRLYVCENGENRIVIFSTKGS